MFVEALRHGDDLDLDPPGFVPVVEHPVGLELLIKHLDLGQARHEHQHGAWREREHAREKVKRTALSTDPHVDLDSSLHRGSAIPFLIRLHATTCIT